MIIIWDSMPVEIYSFPYYNESKRVNIIMEKDKGLLISRLDLNEMKDLASVLERLTKSGNEKIKEEAESSLLILLSYMKKAIKGSVVTQKGYFERTLRDIDKE
ncbi:hypothetical protein ES708_22736 [subsurface metagenome]